MMLTVVTQNESGSALHSPAPEALDGASPRTTAVEGTFLPDVTPLCVFAAGRQWFDAIVRDVDFDEHDMAMTILFLELPLEQNGWDIDTARISLLGRDLHGETIWRLERG